MSAPQAATTLLETVRVRNGVAPLWPLHLERLHRSAAALGIAVGELERPAGGDDRIVRFEVSNGVVRSTEREVGSTAPLALVTAHAVHQGYPHKVAARAWLEAARMPIGSQSTDDVLFFDAEGYLVEASIWAIGWWDRETLVFPPLALGGLPSVARARLAETVRGGSRRGGSGARRSRGRHCWPATRRAAWSRSPRWTRTRWWPICGRWRSGNASGTAGTLDPEGFGGHFGRPLSWCL